MSVTRRVTVSTGKIVAFSVLLTIAIVAALAVFIRNAQASHNVDGLLFVHAIWRHGSRSPTNCYPTDPYCGLEFWPDGAGELSNEGKQQQFELGQWLRRRYANFLPDRYHKNDIRVISMDVPRMVMAASLTLAGLYPPVGDQQWMAGMPWQPIPVSTVPAELAYLIGFPWCNSPEWMTEFLAAVELPHVQQLMNSKRTLIDYVNKWAEFPEFTLKRNGTWLDIWNMEIMRNNLRITDHNNRTLPEWAKPLLNSPEIEEIALLKYLLPVHTQSLATYSVGYFLKTILQRSQAKFNGEELRRMYAYSVREINQISLLKVLGVFDDIRPSFSAILLIEMRLDHDGDPCLEFFYKHSGAVPEAKPLKIPRCGYKCKLRTLYEMFESILPANGTATINPALLNL